MLKKIFKTIFIMSLCVGISLPTNAAVSVSDGSAFVTKAEFAADLNNLSNRMAQLENSLDAKIDSLVSSYLTRNGIWNGANQTLENYYICDFGNVTGLQPSVLTNGVDGFVGRTGTYTATNTQSLGFPTAMNSDYLPHEIDRQDAVIVDSVNKSGLLYMTVNFAPTSLLWSDTNDKRSYMFYYGGNSCSYSQAEWKFDFYIEGYNTVFSSTIANKNVNQYYDSGSAKNEYRTILTFMQTKVLTFVSKGDRIKCRDYFLFKRNTQAGTFSQAGAMPSRTGVIMTVDDCVIY